MTTTLSVDLAERVKETSHENVYACFQCKKCTAGCPMTDHFDLMPHQLIRAVQFGEAETVLDSKTIWLCAGCEACSTRCPQGVDIPKVIDALRIMAKEEGHSAAVMPMPAFYTAALRGIKMFGRMYEAGLMGELYARMALAGQLDRSQLLKWDVPVALHMLKTGKLKPLPPISHGAKHRVGRRGADDNGKARVKAAYYPGCSLHGTAIEFDMSTRAVADAVGLELVEPNGWTCCGTTPAHSTDHLLSTVMPMKNLAKMEETGEKYVSVPCPSCFVRFRTALRDTAADPELKQQTAARTGYEPSPELTVDHLLTTITEKVGLDAVADAVVRPLKGLKTVCYYGCVITRPPELTGVPVDECEYPMGMDHLVEALGAEALDWSHKTECCGVSLSISQLPIALDMSQKVLENAKQVGAEAIVVACPLCHSNLDVRQAQIAAQAGAEYDLPVFYFTQLMGLAFGLPAADLGLDKHFVKADALLREKGFVDKS